MSQEEAPSNANSDDESGSLSDLNTSNRSVQSDDTGRRETRSLSSLGEVYIRADGKKVRRVKRRQKKSKGLKKAKDGSDDAKHSSKPPMIPVVPSQASSPSSAGADEEGSTKKHSEGTDKPVVVLHAPTELTSLPTKATPAISADMLEEASSESEPASKEAAESHPKEKPTDMPADEPSSATTMKSDEQHFSGKQNSEETTEGQKSVAAAAATIVIEQNSDLSPESLKGNADPAVVAASFKALDNLIGSTKEDEPLEKSNPWEANNLPDDMNPWLNAPSFEDSQSLKSAMSAKPSKTAAPPNPFETVFEPMEEEIQEMTPAAAKPTTTTTPEDCESKSAAEPESQAAPTPNTSMPAASSSSISYTYSLPPAEELFDPIAAMANSAAQVVQQAASEDSFGLSSSSLPRFVETPCHSPRNHEEQQPAEQFKDERDPQSGSESEQEGGPLWRAASALSQQSEERRGSKLPEAIRAKTRSRAEIGSKSYQDIVSGASSMYSGHRGMSSHNMHQMGPADDAYIFNATLAKKRVRVVQLLVFGLLGFLVAFLGSFYVQSTCNFAGAQVYVGANNQAFNLHYGLWKYTPIDSAFQGYKYCANYDYSYTSDSPVISRISGISALVLGSYSLLVLWFYLIAGRASYKYWVAAIASASLAGVGQSVTYVFFAGAVCTRNVCSFGPGASIGVLSTIMWFVLSFEMYYNMPTSVMVTYVSPGGSDANLMANLDVDDFSRSMSAYMQRLSFKNGEKDSLPTLNEYRRRIHDGSVGGVMMELNSVKVSGSYKPPVFNETYEL